MDTTEPELVAPADVNVWGASANVELAPVAASHETGLPTVRKEKVPRRNRTSMMKEDQFFKGDLSRLCLGLTIASGFDIVISSIMTGVAFSHGYRDNGVSLFCLGVQSLSHGLSSMLLMVRFMGELALPVPAPAGPNPSFLRQKRRRVYVREKLLSIFMGIAMLISSIALLYKAIRKIKFWDRWYMDHVDMDMDVKVATIFLSWYGVVVYGAQAFLRGYVAKLVQRDVVWYSFIASLVSLAFLFVLGVAAILEEEKSWKAEPIAALILATFVSIEGARAIYLNLGDVEVKLQQDLWC